MKYSAQRSLIEQAVKENKNHPTADEIYSILKVSNPNLSLGTVYRNLNYLSEHGTINKINTPFGGDRFDGETYEHHHIVCNQCNNLFDLKFSLPSELNDIIKEQTGMTCISHKLIVHGICKNCHKKKEVREYD